MFNKAFVTGGTGFIGINLVKLLVEKGWDVTALHRPSSDLTYLEKLPVSLQEGSITNLESLENAIPEDTEVAFHLAGSTNLWSERNSIQTEINVDGTRNMVKAAARKEVEAFIHTSSVSAWGYMDGEITEETPQKGNQSWVNYEYTKWAGEREALKGIDAGMKVVILNPATVTGPHDKNNWGRLFFALQDGSLPGIVNGCMSVTHVRSVAEAHLSAVSNGKNGERYLLGGINCRFSDFVETIARVSGETSNLPKRIPTPLFKLYAKWSELIASITGNEPDITPELAKIMTRRNAAYNSQKAKEELGYRIPPIEKSVRDCYEWLKCENLL